MLQMNFLQEDLLAALQKNAPTTPAIAIKRPLNGPKKPVQTSLLPEEEEEIMQPKHELIQALPEQKAPSAFKTISEAANMLGVPTHVLRFWESQFTQIKPTKSRGGRRYYRPEDMDVLTTIKTLLYKQGYTIKGAKKAFSEFRHDVEIAEQPVSVHAKPAISDKQKAQLFAIRTELLGLKQALEEYL
jgi:DNA-binding transcriptional MerR regulator